ncbi:hypothetical protein [uncultured Eubacterium sp.]|uniref:hypothetical protein n=1 Tax=uncultured Eubacterium sp. TaxID=165185 RepID=UPI000E88D05F|nr:hypothetical protein [uncultured Eubacterium sp.]HAV89815.1 hypothetical protein [Eubacterium sp.]
MRKELKYLCSVAGLLVIVSMIGIILIQVRVIPGGNNFFIMVYMLVVAYILSMIALVLRRKL